MRIICVNTGNKFSDWHTNNLKHMIDNYSGISYDNFEVIREENHTGVFNKLQMFDRFRDGENLYFDLDVCIYDKFPDLKRKKLTVLKISQTRKLDTFEKLKKQTIMFRTNIYFQRFPIS